MGKSELEGQSRGHGNKKVLLGNKQVFSALLASHFLSISDWVKIHIILRHRFRICDALVGCEPLPVGPQRFRMWEKLLLLPSNAGSFLCEEDDEQVKDHVPVYQSLRFGLERGPMVDSPLPTFPETFDTESHLRSETSPLPMRNKLAVVFDDEEEDMKLEYDRFVQFAQVYCQSSKLTPGQSGEIVRDVVRTLPGHPLFAMNIPATGRDSIMTPPGTGVDTDHVGCLMLGRVLQAVALACPQVGYCQGMNFVAVTLLLCALPDSISGGVEELEEDDLLEKRKREISMQMNDSDDYDCDEPETETGRRTTVNTDVFLDEAPERASQSLHRMAAMLSEKSRLDIEFRVYLFMCRLIHRGGKLGMLGLWQTGTPRMKLRVFQLDSIMTWRLPRLKAHFEKIQLQPEILVSQWFMTLFAYTTPLKLTMRIWDYVVLGGWPAMYQVAFAMLASMENQMRTMDLDGIGKLMRDWKRSGNSLLRADAESMRQVLREAADTIITERLLRQLEDNYALEMISMSEVSLAAARARNYDDQNEVYFANKTPTKKPANSRSGQSTPTSSPLMSSSKASPKLSVAESAVSTATEDSMSLSIKDNEMDLQASPRLDVTKTREKVKDSNGLINGLMAGANAFIEKVATKVEKAVTTSKSFATASKDGDWTATSSFSANNSPDKQTQRTLGALHGREATNWLIRYGGPLSEDMALDMVRVRDELFLLDTETELEKQRLQGCIADSLDSIRMFEFNVAETEQLMLRFMEKIEMLDEQLRKTLASAEALSRATVGVQIAVNLEGNIASDDDDDEDDDVEDMSILQKLSVEQASHPSSEKSQAAVEVETLLQGRNQNDLDITLEENNDTAAMLRGIGRSGLEHERMSSAGSYESFGRAELDDEHFIGTELTPLKPHRQVLQDCEHLNSSPMLTSLDSIRLDPVVTGSEDVTTPSATPDEAVAGGNSSPVPLSSPSKMKRRNTLRSLFGLPALDESPKTKDAINGAVGALTDTASPSSSDVTPPPSGSAINTPTATNKSKSPSKPNTPGIINSAFNSIVKAVTSGNLLGSKKKAPDTEEEQRLARAAAREAEMRRISDITEKCQQRITLTTRALARAKKRLMHTTQLKATAIQALEDAVAWKCTLCEQLQLLVQDANKKRSQRLQYITSTYFF